MSFFFIRDGISWGFESLGFMLFSILVMVSLVRFVRFFFEYFCFMVFLVMVFRLVLILKLDKCIFSILIVEFLLGSGMYILRGNLERMVLLRFYGWFVVVRVIICLLVFECLKLLILMRKVERIFLVVFLREECFMVSVLNLFIKIMLGFFFFGEVVNGGNKFGWFFEIFI